MQKKKLISILRKVLGCPTAPFREERVRAMLWKLLEGRPGITLRKDAFGNLIAAYRGVAKPPRLVFVAHMDHPAFVRDPATGGMTFLGGMSEGHLKSGAPTRVFGDARIWDLPAFQLEGDILHSRACDDLTGCAAMVAIALSLSEMGAKTSCLFAFTRGEEVGFVGTYHLAMSGKLPRDVRVISIENSPERPPARIGAGPIIRVGDRMTVFDPAITADLEAAAKLAGLQAQRCLMPGGACEGSAFAAAGYATGALCVALGNYHNCGPENRVAAEYVALSDLLGLVTLGTQFAQAPPGDGTAGEGLMKRLAEIAREHAKYTPEVPAHKSQTQP